MECSTHLTQQEIREKGKQKRLQRAHMSVGAHENMCLQFCKEFLQDVDMVMGYCPVRGEADDLAFLRCAKAQGKTIALPRITSWKERAMEMALWHGSQEELKQETHGLWQPTGTAVSAYESALLLAPLVAFDAKGCRVGMGCGFYDRYIAQERAKGKKLLVLGVVFSWQEVESIHEGAYDIRLDAVMTEGDLRRF